MLDELKFSPAEKAASLGFNLKRAAELSDITRRAKVRTDIDIADRIDAIIEIKSKLDALSENDPGAQRKWLSKRDPFLENKSPFELIRSSHLDELYLVLSLLEKITG
jgi:hypothetical protein